ncbi:MAG: hypothetical protein C5B49_07085, partial [Bdellovibrio sp.]
MRKSADKKWVNEGFKGETMMMMKSGSSISSEGRPGFSFHGQEGIAAFVLVLVSLLLVLITQSGHFARVLLAGTVMDNARILAGKDSIISQIDRAIMMPGVYRAGLDTSFTGQQAVNPALANCILKTSTCAMDNATEYPLSL